MSFIGDAIGGLASGINSAAGIKGAPISNGTNQGEIDQAYGNTQTGLNQQLAFLQALQAQHGLQNQSNVYNQLQGVANGTGPNPAQAMLAQSTGQNVANQAALMAGQRGAAQNVGLIARQAGMQGANAQQQAAGQGAALQAQQSLNALGQAGNIAGQQVGNQANAANAYAQTAIGQQGNLLGAQNAYNNAAVGSQTSLNSANQKTVGGLFQGAGAALGMAHGGMVGGALAAHPAHEPQSFLARHLKGMADGGSVTGAQRAGEGLRGLGAAMADDTFTPTQVDPTATPKPTGMVDNPNASPANSAPVDRILNPLAVPAAVPQGGAPVMYASRGGQVPVMLSPGEIYLSPDKAKAVAEGKASAKEAGSKVPGKPKVSGDSKANDTVPTKLQAGGVVVPRTKAKDEDSAERFVQAILAKSSMKRGK